VRGDAVGVPFRDRLDPSADTASTFTRLSPRGGASVDLGRGASAYLSAGQAFRAPVLLELACADPAAACPLPFALGDDPPLDPVVATTVELGGRWLAGPALLTGALYRTAVRDEIVFVASDAARLAGYFTNLARTRREGLELSALASPAPWLSTTASWTWSRATFRSAARLFSVRSEEEVAGSPYAGGNDVVPGDRLPLVPAHLLTLGATATPAGGLSLGLDLRRTGAQWLRGDEANETAPLPGYWLADARVEVGAGRWEVSGVVDNLFGARAATFGTYNVDRRTGALERFLTPVEGRALTLAVRRRFGR
jgi:outer membrane receptor protein involved in Fe transport